MSSVMPPIPEGEFILFGEVYAHPEHGDALERAYAEITRVAEQEPGIIFYCLARDDNDRNLFHFFERYKGRKAFEEHSQQPLVQKLVTQDRYVMIKGFKAKVVKAIQPTTSS